MRRMSDTNTPNKEVSYQMPPRWLVTLLLSALALAGTLFLQAFGDAAFDSIATPLGKIRTLQLLFLLFCTSVCLAYWVFYRPMPRKLHRRRAVYWARRGKHPFCPFCFETATKQIHLIGPTVMPEARKTVERWECPVCPHCYVSKTGEDFVMHALRLKAVAQPSAGANADRLLSFSCSWF